MPWTAPEVTRPEVPRVADERTMLEAWLDFHRQTLLMNGHADLLRERIDGMTGARWAGE